MRAALVAAIVVLLAAPATAGAAAGERWAWTHVRPANESARTMLLEGAQRSIVVRNLLEALERSDVIVHVTGIVSCDPSGSTCATDGPSAHLAFAAAVASARYLQVTVDRRRAGGWDLIPLLGHELQHALEVAAAPEVRDVRSFERLYYRIGWQSGYGAYETDLARATGRRIQEELRMARAGRGQEPGGDAK